MSKPTKPIPIAEAMRNIEQQVERLENETIPLEDAMEAFESSVAIIRDLQARLSELEQKVQTIGASSLSENEIAVPQAEKD